MKMEERGRGGLMYTHSLEFVDLRLSLQFTKLCHERINRVELFGFKEAQQTEQFIDVVL